MKKLLTHYFPVCLLAISLMAVRCKKPKTVTPAPTPSSQINLQFKTNVSGNPFIYNRLYTNPMGQKYFVYTFLFYIGNPRLVKSDSSEVSLKDILLVNFDPNVYKTTPAPDAAAVGTSFSLSVPAGTYTAFRFGIGVPKNLDGAKNSGVQNSSYPNGHPLSYYRGTYWEWLDLYRFLMIEGRSYAKDSLAFQYHTGYDSLYTEVQFTDNVNLSGGNSHNIIIDIDVNKIFSGINMQAQTTTNMTVGSAAEGRLGASIMSNLKSAMTKE